MGRNPIWRSKRQHFIKVYAFAKMIGEGERLDEKTQFVLEAAALVHYIGIHLAKMKYNGRCDGKLHAQEGPAAARSVLHELAFAEDETNRVLSGGPSSHLSKCRWIGLSDFTKADFLVNLYEDELAEHAVKSALNRIFRTETGICSL